MNRDKWTFADAIFEAELRNLETLGDDFRGMVRRFYAIAAALGVAVDGDGALWKALLLV